MRSESFLKTLRKSWFTRNTIVRNLEFFQNFIIISLCVGLFCVMLIRLGEMYVSLLKPLNFQVITSDILFILILVELFRLLIIYLQEQRISVGAAVEVSLVSALREVILKGVLDIPIDRLLGVCVFLTVLAGLLLVRVWMFRHLSRGNLANYAPANGKTESTEHQEFPEEQYSF
ncbi:phosphate-starvation-inducible PsiE family protein [Coleofasciculus sp.]|uniref:phosphate-starvation-inducible PsiE family protein n=1 Tax=Coleofasciculus sp. TaxID=3100458 RepID=UPI003A341599